MAASKKALQYLPKGAKPETLTYDQLAQWADNAEKATGQRVLGFPAGPTGLMARFLEGYLLPSFTARRGDAYRSEAAVAMWEASRRCGSMSIPIRQTIISCRSRCWRATC